MAEKDVVGKCPHCEKELTWKDIKDNAKEKGFIAIIYVYSCPYCKRIIAITNSFNA